MLSERGREKKSISMGRYSIHFVLNTTAAVDFATILQRVRNDGRLKHGERVYEGEQPQPSIQTCWIGENILNVVEQQTPRLRLGPYQHHTSLSCQRICSIPNQFIDLITKMFEVNTASSPMCSFESVNHYTRRTSSKY